ncbi:hypothetical protein [Methanolacinia paynteri]|uniref:hypothetical protein n=1 Tax=Methanolacinia paynteri TaxID=230356 RepID=UPI00064E9FA4|nr:hypothetical protein [Methanolacinia paynteri]
MRKSFPIFSIFLVLVISAGCIGSSDDHEDIPVNETSYITFSYNNGSSQISVDISAIDKTGMKNSSVDPILVIDAALDDSRAGILLEDGWNIVSVSKVVDEAGNDTKFGELEFRKDNLSFYIVIDEQDMTVARGYSDAVSWISGPVSGPLPEGFHKAKDKIEGWWYVFDIQENSSDSKIAMIYNDTNILYLYPSYSVINTEGIYD